MRGAEAKRPVDAPQKHSSDRRLAQMTRGAAIPSRVLPLLLAASQRERNIAAAPTAAGNGQQPERRRSPARPARRQHGRGKHSLSPLGPFPRGNPQVRFPPVRSFFLFLHNVAPHTVSQREKTGPLPCLRSLSVSRPFKAPLSPHNLGRGHPRPAQTSTDTHKGAPARTPGSIREGSPRKRPPSREKSGRQLRRRHGI